MALYDFLWNDLAFQAVLAGALTFVAAAGLWAVRSPRSETSKPAAPWLPPWVHLVWLAVFAWPGVWLLLPPVEAHYIGNLNAGILAPLALGGVAALARPLRRAALALVMLGLAVAGGVLGVKGFASHWVGGWPPIVRRWPGGEFLSSNHLAAALAFAAAAALVLGCTPRGRWRVPGVCLGLPGFAVFAGMVLLSRSRGSVVAVTGAILIAVATLRPPRAGRAILCASLVLWLIAVTAYGPMWKRFTRVAEPVTASPTAGAPGTWTAAHPERILLTRMILGELRQAWPAGVDKTRVGQGFRLDPALGKRNHIAEGYVSVLNTAWRYGVPAALAGLALTVLAIVTGLRSPAPLVAAAAAGNLALLINALFTEIGAHPLTAFAYQATTFLLLLEYAEARRRRIDEGQPDDAFAGQPEARLHAD